MDPLRAPLVLGEKGLADRNPEQGDFNGVLDDLLAGLGEGIPLADAPIEAGTPTVASEAK
ncbi:hypothetical protein ACWEKM_13145 [Streptomyces sp. NPDC004752]